MPNNDKPGELRNLRIKRVSLVDSGANFDRATGDGAHIMLYKRASDGDKSHDTNKEKLVAKTFLQKMAAYFSETDETKKAALETELNKAFPNDGDADDKVVHKADDSMCKCADCMSKRADADMAKKVGEEVAKRMTDVEKANAALLKSNNELREQVTKAAEAQANREVHEILKSFKATPFDVTSANSTDVVKFRKMRESDPDMFNSIVEKMKAQDAQIAKSALYGNIGTSRSGGVPGSAWGQIVAKSEAIIAKGAAGMSKEKAIEQAMLENPGLVKAYREEEASAQ